MGVIIVTLSDALHVKDVKRRETLTLREGVSSAYNLAFAVKQIAEASNPLGIYTGRVTKQQASARVIGDSSLSPEQKERFLRELNSFGPGDIVKFEYAASADSLRVEIKKVSDNARPKKPLLVVFKDP